MSPECQAAIGLVGAPFRGGVGKSLHQTRIATRGSTDMKSQKARSTAALHGQGN
jgi:hypothetical protein